MIRGLSGPVQALLGSLFTWGVTALGAAGVWVLRSHSDFVLHTSLGFAAGVMTAASFWSLLSPALELSEEWGRWAWVPVAIGVLAGAAFVHAADAILPQGAGDLTSLDPDESGFASATTSFAASPQPSEANVRHRKKRNSDGPSEEELEDAPPTSLSWHRVLLLVVAITIHNIPEGMAVGVGFGAIGSSPKASFENAVTLALGIGLQNFPEGLAVSLPLKGLGYSNWRAFWYGQLSGMVEPVAAVAGALGVGVMSAVLPYALAFAAGAMIFVVFDDIVPEAVGSGKAASWSALVGFVLMMALDVGLG